MYSPISPHTHRFPFKPFSPFPLPVPYPRFPPFPGFSTPVAHVIHTHPTQASTQVLTLADPMAPRYVTKHLRAGLQAKLVDFDDFLDDPEADWRNGHLADEFKN